MNRESIARMCDGTGDSQEQMLLVSPSADHQTPEKHAQQAASGAQSESDQRANPGPQPTPNQLHQDDQDAQLPPPPPPQQQQQQHGLPLSLVLDAAGVVAAGGPTLAVAPSSTTLVAQAPSSGSAACADALTALSLVPPPQPLPSHHQSQEPSPPQQQQHQQQQQLPSAPTPPTPTAMPTIPTPLPPPGLPTPNSTASIAIPANPNSAAEPAPASPLPILATPNPNSPIATASSQSASALPNLAPAIGDPQGWQRSFAASASGAGLGSTPAAVAAINVAASLAQRAGAPAPRPITVGSFFPTSKELRLAVETSLMVNGRGLVCKQGGSRQKKFACAGCGYVLRAVKAAGPPKGSGHWKVSSIENADHPGCIGGRMRPSSKALLDVATVFQADVAVPAPALRAQLQEQGITVNVRQVNRAKNIAERRQRGEDSDQERVLLDVTTSGSSPMKIARPRASGKGGGSGAGASRGSKRRKFVAIEVPDLTTEQDSQVVHRAIQGEVELHRLEQALGGDCGRAVRLRRYIVEHLSMAPVAEPVDGSSSSDSNSNSNSMMADLPMDGINYSRIFGKNCENVVGYVPIPVGVAGPLMVDGEEIWVPLATTEGGLVASVNRGCSAISIGGYGGARTELIDDGITRAPCIAMPDLHGAFELKQWAERTSGPDAGFPLLFSAFRSTTKHGRLSAVTASLAGRHVYLRFKCTTGEAMGMNMISKACEAAVGEIKQRFPRARLITLSGNMCTDKKSSARNWIEGRGKSVVVEVVLSSRTVSSVLKTTVKQMVECNVAKNLVGSAMAGSLGGFNSHAANVVAALFLATGQDPAHTVEGSNCITNMEEVRSGDEPSSGGRPGDLRVSVTLPSLPVGTVGGGTGLPPQSSCLQLLRCRTVPADAAEPAASTTPALDTSSRATGEDGGGGSGGGDARSAGSVIEVAKNGDRGNVDVGGGGASTQRTAINLVAEAAAAAAAANENAAAPITAGASSAPADNLTPPAVPGGDAADKMRASRKERGAQEASQAGGDGDVKVQQAAQQSPGWTSASAPPSRPPRTGASRLACILGAAVLAGEISLLAALASNDLVSAHMALNRKKPTVGRAGDDLTPNAAAAVSVARGVQQGSSSGAPSDAGLSLGAAPALPSVQGRSAEVTMPPDNGNGAVLTDGGGAIATAAAASAATTAASGGERSWRADAEPAPMQVESARSDGAPVGDAVAEGQSAVAATPEGLDGMHPPPPPPPPPPPSS